MREILLFLVLATARISGYAGSCASCSFTGSSSSKIIQSCTSTAAAVVTCKGPQMINASTPGSSLLIDYAYCINGEWFGDSCGGPAHYLERSPHFDCGKPDKCECPFVNLGAAHGNAAPISSCVNTVNHVLECDDDKIYVKWMDGSYMPFSRLYCTEEQWYGKSDGGSPESPISGNVSVKCGLVDEPPFPLFLPTRGGLKYVDTLEDGSVRYTFWTCGAGKIMKLRETYVTSYQSYYIAHAKYIACNSSECYITSSLGDKQRAGPIEDVSCRDYGSFEPGFYLGKIGYFNGTETVELQHNEAELSTAKCLNDGWTITGTDLIGVQLSTFWCYAIPNKVGTCPALNFAIANLRFISSTNTYECWNSEMRNSLEIMNVTTPDGQSFTGSQIQCIDGHWILTSSGADIPAGSSVSCHPVDALPAPPFPLSLPLIYDGGTASGRSSWACHDSTAFVEFDSVHDGDLRIPMHAPFVNCDHTSCVCANSAGYEYEDSGNIRSATCVDMGPKHAACTDPWDHAGIRKGNRYECMKGYFLKEVEYNGASDGGTFTANATDTKYMQCNEDGWQLAGTSISGRWVYSFYCEEGGPWAQQLTDTRCLGTVNWAKLKFQFDFFRKHYTCYEEEVLSYTYNSMTIQGPGRKLFCGKNAEGADEWQWSMMDGTQVEAIPIDAEVTCS